ncbi:flagellar transcriptional regulator FlhD [Acidithiobacillus sulfuriphilus]|nr:flagellar transcriptional regulator FlhD [Acidithiobacillus sulfuriphilus]
MAKQHEMVISPGLLTPVSRPMDMATLRQDAFKLNLSYLLLARDLARQNMALAVKVFRLQEDVLQVIASAPPSYSPWRRRPSPGTR